MAMPRAERTLRSASSHASARGVVDAGEDDVHARCPPPLQRPGLGLQPRLLRGIGILQGEHAALEFGKGALLAGDGGIVGGQHLAHAHRDRAPEAFPQRALQPRLEAGGVRGHQHHRVHADALDGGVHAQGRDPPVDARRSRVQGRAHGEFGLRLQRDALECRAG